MASVKNLKKDVKMLTGELISECFAYAYFHEDADMKVISECLQKIAVEHNDIVDKINNGIYEKGAAKAHFNLIIEQIQKMPEILSF